MKELVKKIQWKKVIGFVVFIWLLLAMLVHLTYLFRNVSSDRSKINGIKKEDNLDVVCVGASSTFVYWEPFLAWKEYGITSYNFAASSLRPPLLEGCVKEVMKYQKPELLIIDVRSLTRGRENISDHEGAIRNTTDFFDLSLNRFLTVFNTLKFFETDENTDKFSYYFDIAKYHSEYTRLGMEESWKNIDNNSVSLYKGWEFIPAHESLQYPVDFKTEMKKALAPETDKVFRHLLEYLSNNKINTLFIVSPFSITQEEEMCYNAVGDICESYGFNFINTNDYYEEMSIDFTKDFYDRLHVNVYGAEKYTRFISDYVKKNYDLRDHRGDEKYQDWDEFAESANVEAENTKNVINGLIQSKKQAYEEGKKLCEMDDIYEWCNSAVNENYTILIAGRGQEFFSNPASDKILSLWGVNSENSKNAIRVYTGTTAIYASDVVLDKSYKGYFTGHTDIYVPYEINSGKNASIRIDGMECSKMQEGLNVVVFDNNYREILDSVVISQNGDGKLILSR